MSKTIINRISSSIGENYSEKDLNLISQFDIFTNFNPSKDIVEFSIYNEQNLLDYINYNFEDYSVVLSSTTENNTFSTVELNPEKDLLRENYTQGIYTVNYNFLRPQLSSSYQSPFYIKEISSDRTEVRMVTNNISNEELEVLVSSFKETLDSLSYFEDFYINFGNNNLYLANNILLDTTNNSQYSVLIKLYEPLENQFSIKDTLWVVTQTTEEVSYNVVFPNKIIAPPTPKFLKGPNLNLPQKDTINQSTTYQNLSELTFNASTTSSFTELQGILNKKGVTINIDYSDFSNFVNFSSAEQRVNNFYYKVKLLEDYSASIVDLTGATATSDTSSSIALYEQKQKEIIGGFEGYEKYQYFSSGSSDIYPKGNLSSPFILAKTGSIPAINWFNDQITSASEYDQENKDRLVNSLPEYTREDNRNTQFFLFMDMVGQHFDNIWSYTNDLSNRFDADNRLTYGISKDLVADAIKSMGVNLYQSNFTSDNLYSAFTYLHSDGSSSAGIPPTAEQIDEYVSLNYNDTGKVEAGRVYEKGEVFYWTQGDSLGRTINFYVIENFTSPAGNVTLTSYFQSLLNLVGTKIQYLDDLELKITPINDINKEFYKRIFHNLPFLLKKKGTVEGLRALINTHGIPDTVLRINEFGGKDKTNSNDWDYFQNTFNYAWDVSGSLDAQVNGMGGEFPFALNSAWGSTNNVPESVMFRFKLNHPETIPSEDTYVALTDFNTGGTNGVLALEYTGSGFSSASYSGSIPSASNEYATLTYYDGVTKVTSVDAPFYNGEWWSVYINKNGTTYTLRTGNNTYEGPDGYKINFYSSSEGSGGSSWASATDLEIPGADVTIGSNVYTGFTGSIQEIRYYNCALDENTFYDFVMNSDSIEGSTFTSSADNLCFRARLKEQFTRSNPTSVHPKVTGSSIVNSFSANSEYRIWNKSNSYMSPHTEFTYQDQPAVGIKNRVSEKIRTQNISTPEGNTLSSLIPVQQDYLTPESGSYTKDINLLEVAFSPQNEINDDINASFGYFNIGEYIGDPRQILEPVNLYRDLDIIRNSYFEKYYKNYNWKDYIRLIKFFDNSLFKMIKDFTPAKSSLASGVVIKQHLLERSKHRPTLVSSSHHEYSASIESGFAKGGTGGVFDSINNLGNEPYWQASGSYNPISPHLTQSWEYTTSTTLGPIIITQSSQDEFYNGELSGSQFQAAKTDINPVIISNGTSLDPIAGFSNRRMYPRDGEIFFGDSDYENTLASNANHLILGSYDPSSNLITTFYIPHILASVIYVQDTDVEPLFDTMGSGDEFQAGFSNAILPTSPFRSYYGGLYNFKIIKIIKRSNYFKVFVEQLSSSPEFEAKYTEGVPTSGGQPVDLTYNWRIYYGGQKIGGSPPYLNPIINNVDNSRKSIFFNKIEYSSLVNPTNIELIQQNSPLSKASIQDSNYSSTSWKRSRYEGSKWSSLDFNIPFAK